MVDIIELIETFKASYRLTTFIYVDRNVKVQTTIKVAAGSCNLLYAKLLRIAE